MYVCPLRFYMGFLYRIAGLKWSCNGVNHLHPGSGKSYICSRLFSLHLRFASQRVDRFYAYPI